MPRITAAQVKDAARGRWHEIAENLFGISRENFLTGKHRPCPFCGGKNRWRVFPDFPETGGAICNQCGACFDGIELGKRATGQDFKPVVDLLAKYLGVTASEYKPPPRPASDDWRERFTLEDWDDQLVQAWIASKPPVTLEAIKSFGARLATYVSKEGKMIPVIAFPAWEGDGQPVGWACYPRKPRPGSKGFSIGDGGIIGQVENLKKLKNAVKAEGPPDALGLATVSPPHVAVITNSAGTNQTPSPWLASLCQGKNVVVVHDCDADGRKGALKWCKAFFDQGATVCDARLPYEIKEKKGKDLRDWLNEGHGWDDFEKLLHQSSNYKPAPERHPDDPIRLAEANLENYRRMGRDIKYWHDTWLAWKDGQYEEIAKEHLQARITRFIQEEFDRVWEEEVQQYQRQKKDNKKGKDKGPPKVRKISVNLIRAVMEATKGLCVCNSSDKLDSWIEGDQKGRAGSVSVENGILDLAALASGDGQEREVLSPHSSSWLSTIKLGYKYDPKAECPIWHWFLDSVFPDDPESIETLQKWFGYLLTPDNSLQKIMMFIGAPRSGKGTIANVISELLGKGCVLTPRMHDLVSPFGLESLVGKNVALVQEALFESRIAVMATERVLSISGGDSQDIHRKFKPTLTNQELPIRFNFFANSLPDFRDRTLALINRCIFLSMPIGHAGKERRTLGKELRAELSGILNWAIQGKKILNRDGCILQPQSGMWLAKDMKMQMNPVLVFLDEMCVLGPNFACKTSHLFEAWESWREKNEVHMGPTDNSFSRHLKKANSGIQRKGKRISAIEKVYYYIGVELRGSQEVNPWETS